MLLSGALFALFMVGFWVYCLTDAILTPAAQCRGLRKQAWVAVISVTFIAGAVAWLIVRRTSVPLLTMPHGSAAGYAGSPQAVALARHPAGRARITEAAPPAPKGPDDDDEFMRALKRAIRRNPPVN